jgi:hypothetical protein
MAALIVRPVLPPGRCYTCTHSSEQFGPYLDSQAADTLGNRIVYCASCAARLVRALDVVPAAKLVEALAERGRAENDAAAYAQESGRIPGLEQTIARLEGELDVARSQIVSLERTIRETAHAAARQRREELLASVAAPTKAKKGK